MPKVTIELSITNDASNLTFDDLRQLIVERPIKDWTKSHGQSVLTFVENGDEKSELSIFAGCKGEGFLVQHSNREDINDIVYAKEGEHTNRVFEYTFGGDVYETFGEYLVSKETLIEAVKVFMQNGGRSEKLEWTEFLVPEFAGSEMQAA